MGLHNLVNNLNKMSWQKRESIWWGLFAGWGALSLLTALVVGLWTWHVEIGAAVGGITFLIGAIIALIMLAIYQIVKGLLP